MFAVRFYGGIIDFVYPARMVISSPIFSESEFWLALGKVILAIGLIAFTFVTMVGGNPLRDIYGFRNWDREYEFKAWPNGKWFTSGLQH